MKHLHLWAIGLAGLLCLTGCTSTASSDSTSASTGTATDSTDSSAADAVYEDTQEFMGTYIMVRTYGEHAQAGAEAAFARAKELEQVFSNTIADSEVNKVNGAAKAAEQRSLVPQTWETYCMRLWNTVKKAAACWTAPLAT